MRRGWAAGSGAWAPWRCPGCSASSSRSSPPPSCAAPWRPRRSPGPSFSPQGSFRGSCPLYGMTTRNGSFLALSHSSAPSLCYFVAGASGFLALYCLLLLLFWVYSSCIEDSKRGLIGLRVALAISAIAIFLVLVSACILRFGTRSFCNSIISLNSTISCSEAQKIPWTPPGTALQFYSNLHNAETSSWVNLVLWCVVLVLQVMQWKSEATPYRPLERGDPEWSSETDVLVGPRLSHS
ncbi:transmembrane protein 179B isoform X2 [Marmota marmota marmota]|uniref:transmembrane protein 179B isoform X2 n=1 Tax=Marmota marmota marmota TaxID=9994 RepID=UPI0020924642|nr:transmembrane protein 179B isoform X2 [Marmota marmota marmota]